MSAQPERSRLDDTELAVDHVRRVARETAERSGYRAAAFALMDLRREYRSASRARRHVAGRACGDPVAGPHGDGCPWRHQGGRGSLPAACRDPERRAAPPPTRVGARSLDRAASGRAALLRAGDSRAGACNASGQQPECGCDPRSHLTGTIFAVIAYS